MTFTCFPLKNTETDGKDSVFTNYLGEVSKKQCDEIIKSPYLIFELLSGINLLGVDAGSI